MPISEKAISYSKGSLLLRVKVIPRSSETRLREISTEFIKIALKAAPVEGKANKELITWLSKKSAVSKNNISIISGLNARLKIIRITPFYENDLEVFSEKISV